MVCGVIAVISLGVAGQTARLAHAQSARGWRRGLAAAARAASRSGGSGSPSARSSPRPLATPAPSARQRRRRGSASGPARAVLRPSTPPCAASAQRFGCLAAMRASYADELDGTVFTVGVVVFPGHGAAIEFAARVPRSGYPAPGLHALDLPGTAAALFTDSARQLSAVQVSGPYVVLAVAGYADGRPAAEPGCRATPAGIRAYGQDRVSGGGTAGRPRAGPLRRPGVDVLSATRSRVLRFVLGLLAIAGPLAGQAAGGGHPGRSGHPGRRGRDHHPRAARGCRADPRRRDARARAG